MSKSTISTFQLFALIPDAETARNYAADIAGEIATLIERFNEITAGLP